MYRKGPGKEAKLSYMGHVLMDNRHGLVAEGDSTQAAGTAEYEAAKEKVKNIPNRRNDRVTVGADKYYDTQKFVRDVRRLKVTPHVAQNTSRTNGIDDRTTRHTGWAISQQKRKRVEESFGWVKTIGLMRKTRHRGKAHNPMLPGLQEPKIVCRSDKHKDHVVHFVMPSQV